MKLFDVTRPIHDGMVVYEGDPRVVVRRVASVTAGASANVSEVHLGSHTGTHVDPPLHFHEGAPGVDELPLDMLIGPARLYALEVRGPIDVVNLRGLDLAVCPRVLFKTRTAGERPEAGGSPAHGGLTAEAAHRLVEAGVRVVGLDGLSADPPGAVGFPAHRTLLDAGVIILEDLDLSAVPPGAYELLCLPLKLRGGDGAPARVVLRSLD
jgi:arylformamidase